MRHLADGTGAFQQTRHAPAPGRVLRIGALLLGALLVLPAAPAGAQYFGRNKVQYKKFDFQVMKTTNFDIYYYPEAKDGIDIAARMAERWLVRLQRILRHELTGRQPLILYASHVDFEQTNAIQGEIGEGTGGVTEPFRRRIILPMGGPLADTDHVIGHELVHAFQFDISRMMHTGSQTGGMERIPLWFIEGMAEYLSLGPDDPHTSMWLRDAARGETLPTIGQLSDPQYFPYRWGQAFWAYVGGRFGDGVIGTMMRTAAATGDPEVAIREVLKLKPEELTADWHRAIRDAYAPVLAGTAPPAEAGTPTLRNEKAGGDLNVGPAISPDGKRVAFLSERDLFSIDLYIADVETGKVADRLTSTASNAHYSSIQFIYSAGAWDRSSRRLAIATVRSGRPALAIFDGISGRREREIEVAGVDEIFNPTWSPDGRAICFTGMARGLTDLFVLDLESGALRELTHDAYADLQPSWAPDGRRIAFATDRFTTNLETLAIGPLRIALLDPVTGAVSEAGGYPGVKNLNPQWSPGGDTIYFITGERGISNLARMPAAGGAPSLVMSVSTGISGITATSPALSVAADTGLAAFSVYDRGKYDIYTRQLSDDDRPAETPPGSTSLPPAGRLPSSVSAMLADTESGLPAADTSFDSTKYKSRFGLEAISQPTIGVGASRFGTFIGGGIAAYFSDMLGDRSLATAVQTNSGISGNFSVKDTAAQVSYIDQSRRWNWGVLAGQIPYLSGGYQESIGSLDGIPSLFSQTIVFRQTERNASLLAAYPLSRSQRLEVQGGMTQLSFDLVTRTQVYALRSGQLLHDGTETVALASPLTLATSSAALVYDSSILGATSPVQGQRYRLEAVPSFGTINYTSVLADYRRYMMPFSFYTLAGRVLHYGRYGSGSTDSRLYPLYLGYPTLVRGYNVRSFDAADCTDGLDGCVTLDRAVGSRLLVANLEFRFPLLRPFVGRTSGMYGPVPMEMVFFADGGVAWDRGQSPAIFGGDRQGLSSAGVSLRTNIFGMAIGEFSFARPFQRRTQGWVFQFNLTPGF